jgi:hypothetical protein
VVIHPQSTTAVLSTVGKCSTIFFIITVHGTNRFLCDCCRIIDWSLTFNADTNTISGFSCISRIQWSRRWCLCQRWTSTTNQLFCNNRREICLCHVL